MALTVPQPRIEKYYLLVMPRFKFQWANLPKNLQISLLPAEERTTENTAEVLKKIHGARPREEFIREQWTTLLDSWLKDNISECDNLASLLRTIGVGDKNIESNIDYLRSCKNTKNLRIYTLQAFLDYGERTPASSPQIEEIRNLTVVASPPEAGTNLSKASGSTLILDGDPETDLRNKARAAVGKLFNKPVDDVVLDNDGDVPVAYGSAAVFVRVIMANPLRYSIFSPLLNEVEETPALYEILNEINQNLIIGSMTVSNKNVTLQYSVVASIGMEELALIIDYMTDMADLYDNKLQEYVGGNSFFREKNEDEVDV